MLKVAALILDAHDDVEGKVARLLPTELHLVPLASQDEVDALPDSHFGLVMKSANGPTRRRFPLHNADAIKLSEAYFEKTREHLPEAVVKVAERKFAEAKAGVLKGVAFVDLAKVAAAPRLEVAADAKVFGLTIGSTNYYPLHDAGLVKQALANYPRTISGMIPEHRFAYACNIEKQAKKFGVTVPVDSLINRYTNPTFNKEALATAIEQRKQAAYGRGTDVLDQLAAACGITHPQTEAESRASYEGRVAKVAKNQKVSIEQTIAVLEGFDKLAGIGELHYNRGLLDPFAACYKLAACDTGAFVDGVNLSTINPEQLATYLNPEFLAEFQSNPVAVYQRSPDPLKAIMRDLAQKVVPRTNRDGATESPGDPVNELNPVFANSITSVRGL